jgi:hypothetical protein
MTPLVSESAQVAHATNRKTLPVRRVAIWVRILTHFHDMLRVGRLLARHPGYEPVLVFPSWYERIEEHLAVCRSEALAYLALHPFTGPQDFDPKLGSEQPPVGCPTDGPQAVGGPRARQEIPAGTAAEVGAPAPTSPRPTGAGTAALVSVRTHAVRPPLKAPGLVKGSLKGLLSWETRNAVRQTYLRTKSFLRTNRVCRFGTAAVRCIVEHLSPRSWYRTGRAAARSLANVSRAGLDYFTGGFRQAVGEVRQQRREAEAVLDRVRPDLLIFAEDNVEFETGALTRAGHLRGIPSVVVPYTIGNAREAAESYYDQPDLQAGNFLNRIVSYFRPQWLNLHRGRWLVRMSAWRALARHWWRVAPPLPWVLNSGQADAVTLENEAVLDGTLRAGLPRQQLVVTGSLRLDELANRSTGTTGRRRRLLWELGLPERRRVVLCALPPNQRPQARAGCEFGSYTDLLDFWLSAVRRLPDCNVLINPHPRCPPDEVARLKEAGAAVVPGDIAHFIPLCDVYVASVSATITMAVACGKPVVNYDVYHYHYDDFDGCPLVETVHTRAEFQASLEAALDRTAEAEPHPYWGLVDGRAGQRLIALFDALIAHKEIPPAAWQPHAPKVLRRPRPGAVLHAVAGLGRGVAELVY